MLESHAIVLHHGMTEYFRSKMYKGEWALRQAKEIIEKLEDFLRLNKKPSLPAPVDIYGDGVSSVSLIQYCGNDKGIVNAARTSFGNDRSIEDEFNEKDSRLLARLLGDNHGSVLEHNLLTFRLTIPLFVVQELLRHRVGCSFSQLSMRYSEPGKNQECATEELKFGETVLAVKYLKKFYTPKIFRRQSKENKQGSAENLSENEDIAARAIYISQCERAFEAYESLISIGVARELARGVLPHSTYTSLYFTCNLRSLLHFLGLRQAPGAQEEIRILAGAMRSIAEKIFPHTFKYFEDKKNG